jgi:hypothetical protein
MATVAAGTSASATTADSLARRRDRFACTVVAPLRGGDLPRAGAGGGAGISPIGRLDRAGDPMRRRLKHPSPAGPPDAGVTAGDRRQEMTQMPPNSGGCALAGRLAHLRR